MAAGCYATASRMGLRIPDDLSVVGFDNQIFASYMYPSLTTVALPNKQIGLTAAQHLLWKLEGRQDVPSSTVLPCQGHFA